MHTNREVGICRHVVPETSLAFLKGFAFALFITVLVTPAAMGQSTSHVFPQYVAGTNSDGSFWQSLLYATNSSGASTSCSLTVYGLNGNGPIGIAFPVANGTWGYTLTAITGPLATGYARLDCDQPVTAALVYSLVANDKTTTLGMSTVFSAPPTNYAMLPVLFPPGLRTGIALANDNDTPGSFTVRFTDKNGNVTNQTIQIAARSHYAAFVDEVIAGPTSTTGSVEIVAPTGLKFSVTGLLFAGNIFSTLVPTF